MRATRDRLAYALTIAPLSRRSGTVGTAAFGETEARDTLFIAHSRIEPCIADIDQQVHDDIDHGNEQGPTLNDIEVSAGDGRDRDTSDPLAGEDRLDDDGAAQQITKLKPDNCHRRNK